jgi:hypothetical protein
MEIIMIVIERRKNATHKVLVKIAELKIKEHNLQDTPEQYIIKCMSRRGYNKQ